MRIMKTQIRPFPLLDFKKFALGHGNRQEGLSVSLLPFFGTALFFCSLSVLVLLVIAALISAERIRLKPELVI